MSNSRIISVFVGITLFVLSLFITGVAYAGSVSGDIGAQTKVVYQGVRYDTSIINPFVTVKYTVDSGAYVQGSAISTQFTGTATQLREAVTVGFVNDVGSFKYNAYATKHFYPNTVAQANSDSIVGIKGEYGPVLGALEYTVDNSNAKTASHNTYGYIGASTSVAGVGVTALVSAKQYNVRNVTRFNNAEVTATYNCSPQALVFVTASYGGKDDVGTKIPNQGSVGIKYLF